MGEFGHELRREREARGVALENITGATKISGRHLLALEQERFAALPGGVLNKGIVRGYARACGLDEDAWVRRYLSTYRASEGIKDDDQSWMAFAENVSKTRKNGDPEPDRKLRWAGVAVMLLVLALFAWYVLALAGARPAGLLPGPVSPSAQTRAQG